MSTRKDPLLDVEAPDRVYYATGVLLDAGDFGAEQTYHRARLARALAYLHGYGTAAGLKVVFKAATSTNEDEIEVHPGVAVDQLGRLVEIQRRACIRIKRWYESHEPADLQTNVFTKYSTNYNTSRPEPVTTPLPEAAVVGDVFLRFYTRERGKTPAFAAGPFDATDAVQPSRLRDGYELRFVLRERLEGGSTPEPAPLAVPKAKPWPLAGGSQFPQAPSNADDLLAKLTDLHEAILSSFHDSEALRGALRQQPFLPLSLRTDKDAIDNVEVDPAWIFLARVVIGITVGQTELGPDDEERPKRSGVVLVDNEERPFSYTAAALARWLGL